MTSLHEHPAVVRVGDEGAWILRRAASPAIDQREARIVARRLMALIGQDTGAAGLAAPQIGVGLQVCAVKFNGAITALINPRVVALSPDSVAGIETCFSIPGEARRVMRPTFADVAAENVKGKTLTRRYEGWNARIVLHELDHLLGVLITDLPEAQAAA